MAEYKIRDIEALTGIKAHTIRIWEKRYGILVPDRTASKIRTYSEADLMLLLNVSILNQNGIKISKIAQMSVTELKDKVRAGSFSKESESAVLSLLIGGLIEFDTPNIAINYLKRRRARMLFELYFTFFRPYRGDVVGWLDYPCARTFCFEFNSRNVNCRNVETSCPN